MVTSELRDQQYDVQDDVTAVCDEELAQKHLVSILERISTLGRSHQPGEQTRTLFNYMYIRRDKASKWACVDGDC